MRNKPSFLSRRDAIPLIAIIAIGLLMTATFVTFERQDQDAGARSGSAGSICQRSPSPVPARRVQQSEAATALPQFGPDHPRRPVDMKLLVISADGKETDLASTKTFLDRLGIPYDVLVAKQSGLAASMLSDGDQRGYYQGIILATANLTYDTGGGDWETAFGAQEWQILREYEAAFGARQVTSFTYPSGFPDSYGLEMVGTADTTRSPLTTELTEQGREVFWYLNPGTPIAISNAWTYLAQVVDRANTTPLLVTPEGHAIASIHRHEDGRENLAVTAANNQALRHSALLSYGIINWVTRGLFLGERHVNMDAQVDDLLISTRVWDTTAMTDTSGLTYRMDGNDLQAAVAWQNSVRDAMPEARTLSLELAFNGRGAGIVDPDTLTPASLRYAEEFNWISHTYSHQELDYVTYDQTFAQLKQNNEAALGDLGFSNYWCDSLVQPSISGLENPEFLRSARDFGIRFLISDASRSGWDNPSPNAGVFSKHQPQVFVIPRRATGLPFSVSTPVEWVSASNYFIGPPATCEDRTSGREPCQWTYEAILEVESEGLLRHLLNWDMDPLMFHQTNLRAYDGVHSILSDLLEITLTKYVSLYNLPIRNLSQHEVGLHMINRMAYNEAEVRGRLTPCVSITLEASKPALVPITGLAYGKEAEIYGGQDISYVRLSANTPVTLPAPACR